MKVSKLLLYFSLIVFLFIAYYACSEKDLLDVYDKHYINPEENPQAVSFGTDITNGQREDGFIPDDNQNGLSIELGDTETVVSDGGKIQIPLNITLVDPNTDDFISTIYYQVVGAQDYLFVTVNANISEIALELSIEDGFAGGTFTINIVAVGRDPSIISNTLEFTMYIVNQEAPIELTPTVIVIPTPTPIVPTPTSTPSVMPTPTINPTPTPTPIPPTSITSCDSTVVQRAGGNIQANGGAIQDCEVINCTGYDIYYLYITADTEAWDNYDVLGSQILYDGDTYFVSFNDWNYGDHCIFDFKAIDVDGDEYYKWGVDLCSVYTVIFTLGDISN